MVDRLISLGVIPNKTGSETMKYVPDEWKTDFIRGFFDGDGSISIRNDNSNFSCFICSQNKEILSDICNYLKIGNIVEVSKYSKAYSKPFYQWRIQKKCDLELFRNTIYSNGQSLSRKRELLFSIDTKYKICVKHGII
jgi:intein-encoded DNA endonuclease-like protein